MAITSSKTIYGHGFGPFIPGVYFAPFPYCHHCPVNRAANKSCDAPVTDLNNKITDFKCCFEPLNQLELMFKQQTAPEDTAAIIIEPVLGEGGYVVPPKGYLKALRDLCNKYKILLIADEVQSGYGRTGKHWAVEHFDIIPDILIFAKGVANGFPLSGIASSQELMANQIPGSMGGTYAGNGVSCAAAVATLKAFKEENILDNVNKRGKQLKEGLIKLQQKHKGVITDIRGLGLMIGVEFEKTRTGLSNKVVKECVNEGMLLLTTSCFESVRFIPPLNVTAEEIEIGLRIFDTALQKALA